MKLIPKAEAMDAVNKVIEEIAACDEQMKKIKEYKAYMVKELNRLTFNYSDTCDRSGSDTITTDKYSGSFERKRNYSINKSAAEDVLSNYGLKLSDAFSVSVSYSSSKIAKLDASIQEELALNAITENAPTYSFKLNANTSK